MYDETENQELDKFAKYMSERWDHSESEVDNCDLVLEVRDDARENHKFWCYYFVNHTTKAVFWLEPYNACEMIMEVKGITLDSEESCISES